MEFQSLSPNIGVQSVNDTIKFYSEMFGFQLAMSVPKDESGVLQWAMMTNGTVNIMFQEMQNLLHEYPQLNGRSATATLTFYVKMKNIRELYHKVKDTEYLATEMHKTFYGTDEFAVFDNNGYILTIAEGE